MPRKLIELAASLSCETCSAGFAPKRKDQRYCSKGCARKATRNATRTTRTKENKRMNEQHYDRARAMFRRIYSVAPNQRLGVMQYFLSLVPTDADLRRILSDPALLSIEPRADGRKNVAKAADAYVRMFHGIGIRKYIKLIMSGQEVPEVPINRPEVKPEFAVPNIRHKLRKPHCWHRPLQPKTPSGLIADQVQSRSELAGIAA